LLEAGARCVTRATNGVTPMTLAILADDAYSVRLLIEHGYPIDRVDAWNEYPFEHAVRIHAEGAAMMIAHLGCRLSTRQGNDWCHAVSLAANEGLVHLMFLIIYMQPRSINQRWIRQQQYPRALFRLLDVQSELQRMLINPFRLKQLCRANICRCLGKFYMDKLETLLSASSCSLTDYLRYRDIVDPMKHFRSIGKQLAYFQVAGIEFYWDQQILRYRQRHANIERVNQPTRFVRVRSTGTST
jgi:hypothetical protein